jgi:hypothetical protein
VCYAIQISFEEAYEEHASLQVTNIFVTGTKQLVSSAQQYAAHWSLVVKKCLAEHNVMALEHLPYSPGLSLPDLCLHRTLKCVPKGHFTSTDKVTAKATRTLEVLKNGFQECFHKLYKK